MNKLKLTLDEINVTGFEVVARTPEVRGTVQGAALTRMTYCYQESCFNTCFIGVTDCQ